MADTFLVPPECDGKRLDQVLAALAPSMSRRAARARIEAGAVYLDGRRCRVASRAVAAGARVALEADFVHRDPPEGADAVILWRHGPLLAVDKPAGVPLVPTRSAVVGTVLHGLARKLKRPVTSLHPAHRLDAAVSGVALVALEPAAAAEMGRAFAGGRVRKSYVAWVEGIPDPAEGVMDAPLLPARGGVVRTSPEGRPARTAYRVLHRSEDRALVLLEPMTGRTHQLRVHCAHAGHPIVGDLKYGRSWPGGRLLLHALRLAFPFSAGKTKVVVSPLPEVFLRDPTTARPLDPVPAL